MNLSLEDGSFIVKKSTLKNELILSKKIIFNLLENGKTSDITRNWENWAKHKGYIEERKKNRYN